MGDLCCHAHSKEDREQSLDAMKEAPKVLPHQNESMQYYQDSLDEYLIKKTDAKKKVPPVPAKKAGLFPESATASDS